ncbi:MAG: ABC transporter, partial [Planctomycetes bacterium]|nr:ABC transporter [Planctomycetota bacterium]
MDVLPRLLRQPLVAVSVGVLLVIVAVAVFAPWLAPHGISAREADLTQRWQRPSREHPFGTDGRGVDVLSRVVHGTRI